MDEPYDHYLYHVTYFSRLESITNTGLEPGHRGSIGSSSFNEHREGAIFFTEWSGVSFWHGMADEWAMNATDSVSDDGFVPVVLRVHVSVSKDCIEDELGSNDAGHLAMKCSTTIDPEDIEVWSGTDWVPVDEYWNEVDPDLGVDDHIIIESSQSPLVPTDEQAGQDGVTYVEE